MGIYTLNLSARFLPARTGTLGNSKQENKEFKRRSCDKKVHISHAGFQENVPCPLQTLL